MTRRSLLAHFGSLRTTLACMALLAAALGARLVTDALSATALTLTLTLLAINLVAALFVHPLLRRQLPLLVAHLGLLAVAVLAGLGRMAALDGRFELAQGVAFDGQLIDGRLGPWHGDGLQRIAFRHEGFEIDYAPGRKRGATRNTVTWVDANGSLQQAVIGDHRPLVLDGYRIYTSPNKGFAPVLSWRSAGGDAETGTVHLPSFPVHELRQSREWHLPDGRAVWVMLQFDDKLIDPQSTTAFALPAEHRLVVRLGEQRQELAAGQRADIGGGTLTYLGLRTWMGYRVTYDPTLPWLLVASLLSTLGFGWHYVRKFSGSERTARRAPAADGAAWAEPVDG